MPDAAVDGQRAAGVLQLRAQPPRGLGGNGGQVDLLDPQVQLPLLGARQRAQIVGEPRNRLTSALT